MSQLHDKAFPGESAAYRAARDELLRAELELRDRIEAVAAQRRALPLGGALPTDYAFEEVDESGAVQTVRLSELFAPDKDTLLLYNFMYGPDWEKPCPMCTSVVDGWEGNAAYVTDRVDFAVVAKAPAPKWKAWAEGRGWHRVRLLSSHGNDFNADYHAEFDSSYGDQHPVLHVFVRRDGAIHHSWSSEVLYAATDGQPRHVDATWPLWNLLDLTPEGRGTDWYPEYQR